MDTKAVNFYGPVTTDGNCICLADINVTGTSYLNGDAIVNGTSFLNGDAIVNGATMLHTNASNDVAIIDSAANDTMRINDAGDITLKKAGVVFTTSLIGSAGLYLNTISKRAIALFKANRDDFFYGNTLNAITVKATNGLVVSDGSNGLEVNA